MTRISTPTPLPNILPFPISPTPLNPQLLQLTYQAQHQLLSINQMTYLYSILGLPLTMDQKLAIYNWLCSLPLPTITPWGLIGIIMFGPLLTFVFFIMIGAFVVELIKMIVLVIISRFVKVDDKKTLIQLTFPAQTSKSAYATEQLYSLLHTLSRKVSFWDNLAHHRNAYSLEIVSSKKEGIRFLLAANAKDVEVITSSILSYLPGVQVKTVGEYLTPYEGGFPPNYVVGFVELKLSSHFALPLDTQKVLTENDPISYLTGHMTKLQKDELAVFQVVVSPVIASINGDVVRENRKLKLRMIKGQPLGAVLHSSWFGKLVELPGISVIWLLIRLWWMVVFGIMNFIFEMISTLGNDGKGFQTVSGPTVKPQQILNPYEQELSTVVKGKIDQQLFETSIRILVVATSDADLEQRMHGLTASLGQMSSPYQSLVPKTHPLKSLSFLPFGLFRNRGIDQLFSRSLSQSTFVNHNPILSTSELSDLYHFPYTDTTKTEGMAKVHSAELPAPLSVKNTEQYDVVFGKNTYAGSNVDIGLSDDDRSRHVYLIGQTGSGKTTILYHMAKDDIAKGRGLAIVDPHGDLAEDLLATVPDSRMNDCIYFNPFDIKYPIGINLLELTPHLDDDEMEQEKELVCESVISIFRRVFNQDEHADAHRIEYILRNTIYTAFTVKDATIFTVYELLTDPKFQKSVTKNLEDENLANFWKNEFGQAGGYQVVKMVSGVTAKVGRFLFSPTAKRILEQPHSTINFNDILATGKILICNLSEGNIGEDTTQLLGTTIIAKIQQAAMRRVRTKREDRKPFYLFIDEFQTFATSSFTKLLSGGRKFGLRLTIAEQSTAQQSDRNMVNVILANTGTVICFRTASPMDEELMLDQFAPYVQKGEIGNLPRYHFYMKLSAIEPEEPFSGTTLPMNPNRDDDEFKVRVDTSRKNFAILYQKPQKKVVHKMVKQPAKPSAKTVPTGGSLGTTGVKK